MAKSKFKFPKPNRTADDLKRRKEQRAGSFDSYVVDEVSLWRPADGQNRIRILPPTWEDARHYGYDIYIHYGVGADNQSYLCPQRMKKEPCPICEERAKAVAKGDDEAAKAYAPKKRVMVYLVDRKNEDDGVKVWAMPWTLDRDLAERQVDPDTNEVLLIDDPEEGYDVMFSREQKGGSAKFTGYVGIDIARRPSPLSDDEDQMREWLSFIVDNPIPSILRFYDYDHIKAVFFGGLETREDESEDEGEEVDDEKVESLKAKLRAGKRSSIKDEDEDEGEDEEEKEDEDEPPFAMDEDEGEEEDEEEDSIARLKSKYRKRRAG